MKQYKSTFPNWPANEIQNVVSGLTLDSSGRDLLNVRSNVFRKCCGIIRIAELLRRQLSSTRISKILNDNDSNLLILFVHFNAVLIHNFGDFPY